MENASKALIIAGAILLSIAIIGIGMTVFTGAQDAVNKANMSEAEITTFNGKFEGYEGTRISGSRIKQLLNAVRSHNNANIDDFTRQIRITDTEEADTNISTEAVEWQAETLGSVRSGEMYTVVLGYNDNTGLIVEIAITPNSEGSEGITGTAGGR